MPRNEFAEMRELDEAAERAGGFVAPFLEATAHFDYRELMKYCKARGVEPLDLTIRELHKFLIKQ